MLKLLKSTWGNRGFTILEVLLSIAIISIIAGISIPVYQNFQTRNDLNVITMNLAQSLRRAAMLSQAVDGDTSWGVRIQNGSVTLFKGLSYAGRDVNYDEILSVPTSIVFSGVSEVVYSKFTGFPQTTGTITLTANNGEAEAITINAKGTILY